MKLLDLYTTQKNLRRKEQIRNLVNCIHENEYIEPVILCLDQDGNTRIEDGHHRCVAYYLSGRTDLKEGEYILLCDATKRNTICELKILIGLVV